ncbi:PQQ-binding-like beta-propeller repeat protein [Chthonobacter rhizosphaerae]|uniref:outer membrane protein assembly factor BamB family protein n=1 Tax=Chthonobacter rhizosphaerae TaxID=2735553 RepID=UPI0015EFCC36|nr:PQQ-binding-like beta-propeller repeat protein [Chthonobacter rhizosphaerae]
MTIRPHRAGALVLLAAAVGLASCADGPGETLSGLNPFKQEEQVLPGARRAVLPGSDPVAASTGRPAVIGQATALADWSQPGGTAGNNPGNVAVNGTGARAFAVKAGSSGSGSGFGFGLGSSAGIRVAARPVIAGGRIYAYSPTGVVSAHGLANGGRAWSADVSPDGEDAAVSGGGVASEAGRVFAATGYGELVALDAASGAEVWRSRLTGPARGAPTASGGKVFVVTRSNSVHAVDAATGKILWTGTTSGSGASLVGAASPAVGGGLVIVPSSSGEILAFDVATGEQKWGASVGGGARTAAVTGIQDASASPVINDGVVYATGISGRVIAVRLATGEEIWAKDIGSAHMPVVSGGAVFLVDLDDRLVALDRSSGDVLWATQLPVVRDKKTRTSWAGPLLGSGRLWLVSVDGKLITVDAVSGVAGTTAAIGVEGVIAPVAAGGTVVVLGGDGSLVALN